jgi:hypothetical protein
MARCEVCGNEYDKSFEFESAAACMCSTASNARFTPLHRLARIAIARSSATEPRRTAECTAVRIALIRRESQTSVIAHNHRAVRI